MSILSGFFKTKKYRKTDDGYRLQSEWTSSETVVMNNEQTLEDKFTWKNLNVDVGYYTGGQTIVIPDNIKADELFIKINFTVNMSDTKDVICTLHIPSIFLQSDEGQYYRTGYSYNSANCGVASCYCSKEELTLTDVYLNGKSIIADVTWVVYYR